jgi:hypothetical protein
MVCVPGISGHRPASSFPAQWWNKDATDDKAATSSAATATATTTSGKKEEKKDSGRNEAKKETKESSSGMPSPPDVFIMANDEYKLKVSVIFHFVGCLYIINHMIDSNFWLYVVP